MRSVKFVDVIGEWINRYFSNEEAIFVVVSLVVGFVVLLTLGTVLAPILTGLVFAFLLEGAVARLEQLKVPRLLAICLVEVLFLGTLIALLVGVLPLVWRQLGDLVNALPGFIDRLRELAQDLSQTYPEFISANAVNEWIAALTPEVTALGRTLLQGLVAQLPNVLGLLIFVILAPIALFFFLKDKRRMLASLGRLLPRKRGLLDQVGSVMNVQIGNYMRGKVIEILIVGIVTFMAFSLLGLNYAALLGLLVGISVLIPYVGAAVVTIPVAAVGLLQFGWTTDFLIVVVVYAIIQALDGNVLVPFLFSKAVNLHPIAIIVAVLVFGGIWGFWGVFFAIPLATLVKAVYNAWPNQAPPRKASRRRSPSRSNAPLMPTRFAT